MTTAMPTLAILMLLGAGSACQAAQFAPSRLYDSLAAMPHQHASRAEAARDAAVRLDRQQEHCIRAPRDCNTRAADTGRVDRWRDSHGEGAAKH